MRNQRQSNTRILSFTQQRVKEGYELPIESKKAELAAARTEQHIVQLESRESQLQQQLAALMGIPPGQRIDVATEPLSIETSERERDIVDQRCRKKPRFAPERIRTPGEGTSGCRSNRNEVADDRCGRRIRAVWPLQQLSGLLPAVPAE